MTSGRKSSIKKNKQGNPAVNTESPKKKNLSYEECKKLSDEYLLPNKVVYELHSEFNSLIDMQAEKMKKKNNEADDDQSDDEDSGLEEGILIDVFKDACPILKEKFPEVVDRILIALNISVFAKKAKITWPKFLMFYALQKYYTAT